MMQPATYQTGDIRDVLLLRLDAHYELCWLCGTETPCHWGLPVYEGQIVPNSWDGSWGSVPACEGCHDMHETWQGVASPLRRLP